LTNTAVGPNPHLRPLNWSSLPVGSSSTGPAPQIRPLAVGFLGEKKKLCTMSPMPDWLVPGTTSFWSMRTGRIVRLMTFHSAFNVIGTTGCTLMNDLWPCSAAP